MWIYFTNNNAITTDNLSINTSKINETNDIKALKENLKPKKKENIYFSRRKKEKEKEKKRKKIIIK